MDDSSGKRPYIRLNSQLPNITRSAGGEIRIKCEAAAFPLPIEFTWLKNNAPIEKNRRTKIKSKDYFSKLIITELEILDSGYYQCTASNVAGSVNTTAVLRVNTQISAKSPGSKPKKPQRPSDYGIEDENYDYSEGMDRGRLPSDEEADLFRVPNNAAGSGYVPLTGLGGQDRWLDGVTLRTGDCVLYQGDACRTYLSGKHIMVTSESREAMYDIDRQLRAAMMYIQNIPDLSLECKGYSHAVACYHMYKVCDQTSPSTSSNKVISLCRKDCESLKDEVCPQGFSMAAQHKLVGDDPKALLPHCSSLSMNANRCLRVLEPIQPPPPITPKKETKVPHWCFVDSGKKYEGPIGEAVSGRICLPWTQIGDETYNVARFPHLSKARNHCRNPDGKMSGPWCFTKPHGERELCDVPRCPKGLYPELGDSYGDSGVLDSINNAWGNLSSQWQLAAMGGVAGFALLLLLLLICCCCKKRKSSGSNSSSMKKINGYPIQSCNGSSVGTSGYGRKYPGSSGGGSHMPQYEMNALLPQTAPPNSAYAMQGGYMIPPGQQYSPPTTEPPVEPFHINEIMPQQLKLDKLLGEGQFTLAYVGEFITERGLSNPIAVKALKPGFSHIERETFEDEIKSIASFDHMNVIRMLGVSYLDGQQLSAVFDFNCHGNLHEFLKVREPLSGENDDKEKLRNFEDFFRIGGQIASGMEFLNVYSFGVVLWEIYTYGRQPYEGFSNQEVVRMIGMHDLLPCPGGCPPNVYSVMIECWNEAPERRPSFPELHARFQKWCLAGPSQFFMNTNRANSSHSGGSSGKRQGSSNPSTNRNGPNFINDPFQVPPPAPVHSTPVVVLPCSMKIQEKKFPQKLDRPCRKAAINQLCRICSDKAHGFHFGVMVCRACAAFFRRTIALNLQYHCRFNRNCEIASNGEYPSVRSMCRACRFYKCTKLGMKPESVQVNREGSLLASPTTSLTPPTNPSMTSASPTTLSSPTSSIPQAPTPSFDYVEIDLFNRINNIFENAHRHPKTSCDISIIDQFRIGLNQMRINRQTRHTIQIRELAPYHGTEEFKVVWKDNWEKIGQMAVVEIDLIAEMISHVRPFITLPLDQRWIIFKKFWLSFARLERGYETYRVLGDDVSDTRTLLYNGQCLSMVADLMKEAENLEKESELRTVVSIYRPTRTLMIKGLLNPLKKLKPTEIEFTVMCLHLLWLNPGVEAVTDETNSIADLCRQQCFNELHYYYTQQLGISNYAVRLGEFMALMSTVEKYVVQKKENMIISELFSLVKVNPACRALATS
ncbi:hypothetical protein FO519_002254 [Halicephalobus sp. NKZ332]|nr:hypothetical protein FO519_002254 [Halicephalobus sp. NKZ332]